MDNNKVWLITGAGRGMGVDITKAALAAGYKVVATGRNIDNVYKAIGEAQNLLVVKLNVTSKADAEAAVNAAIEKFGRIDVLVNETKKAFENSLKRLQLDYLDLYLIHQPFGDVYGEWKAMQELYKEGRVRAIGVSNFHPDRLIDLIIHNEIIPAVNQVETHPFHQQIETQKFLRENNVQIESWGPFAEGKNNLFHNEVLASIGKKYNKSIAQVVIRWLIQRGVIAIPKSVRKERMEENFNSLDFELSNEDMEAIKALDTNASLFFDHRDPAMVKWLGERKLND